MFYLNMSYIDELWRQTNLGSASGEFVDKYISGLMNYGRKGRSDEEYKDIYDRILYTHNSTSGGIAESFKTVTGNYPLLMYEASRRGAYYDSNFYWDDDFALTVYGSDSASAFVGIIELSRKPDDNLIDELCTLLDKAKAAGVLIYLKWPADYVSDVDVCVGDFYLTESDCSTFSDVSADTSGGDFDLLEVV